MPETSRCENAEKTVDVIIPVYRPKENFRELLRRLCKQDYPIRRLIIMNTEEAFWNREYEMLEDVQPESGPVMEVRHLSREEFDHGGTRDQAIRLSTADICLLMTQDAVPADRHLVSALVKALGQGEDIAVAYGRQLPFEDCSVIERYTRAFNYPEKSRLKSKEDLKELGIKTYFCSNVCAAYDRVLYERLGGFTKKTIFNEDMIYAAGAIKEGYRIAYAAEARVYHSHNYSLLDQLHRNFDLAVSQSDHPEIFAGIPSEGEGIRLVKKTGAFLIARGKWFLLPQLVLQSGFKYMGYFLGKRYKRLPRRLVFDLTMNKSYWKESVSRRAKE